MIDVYRKEYDYNYSESVERRLGYGELTREHAASSYGQLILVVDGQAYGPGDCHDLAIVAQALTDDEYHQLMASQYRSLVGR